MGGALIGASLQSGSPAGRSRSAFAALLAAIGIWLIVGMSTTTIILAIGVGLAAGVMSGLFGVGGGILFVPALVALGLGQVEAAATSLLAIVPTAAVGTWRQARYGNLRVKPALVVGVASIVGVEIGVRIATSLPEHAPPPALRRAAPAPSPHSSCGVLAAVGRYPEAT